MMRWTALATIAAATALAACSAGGSANSPTGFGGDASRGAVDIGREQCGACHEIPGIQDADGLVGPPLTHFSRRTVVAGLLPNTPAGLVKWMRDPQAVTPGNAMPNMDLSDAEARDIAAYLYTLR